MNKFFKNLWEVIMYPVLYFGVQSTVTVIYMVIAVIFMIFNSVFSAQEMLQPDYMTNKLLSYININIVLIISVAVTFLFVLLLLKKEWKVNKFWDYKNLKVFSVILCVLLGVAFSFFIEGAISLFFEATQMTMPEQPIDGIIGNNLILELFSIALLGPILEELIFRGIVQKRLMKITKLPTAIILQAIIFGLIHLNILQSTYAFVVGIVLGLVYLWADSIWAAIAVHVVFNATSVIMYHIAGDTEIIEIDSIYFMIIFAAALIVSTLILFGLYKQRTVKKVVFNRWAF